MFCEYGGYCATEQGSKFMVTTQDQKTKDQKDYAHRTLPMYLVVNEGTAP